MWRDKDVLPNRRLIQDVQTPLTEPGSLWLIPDAADRWAATKSKWISLAVNRILQVTLSWLECAFSSRCAEKRAVKHSHQLWCLQLVPLLEIMVVGTPDKQSFWDTCGKQKINPNRRLWLKFLCSRAQLQKKIVFLHSENHVCKIPRLAQLHPTFSAAQLCRLRTELFNHRF